MVTSPADELVAQAPTLVDRITYAIQAVGELGGDRRDEMAPIVKKMNGAIGRVLERSAAEGLTATHNIYIAYMGLCHLTGAPPPRLPSVATPKPSKQSADRAYRAIEDFETKGEDLVDGERSWLTNNWAEFLKHTSQNPRLSWTEGQFDAVIIQRQHTVFADNAEGAKGEVRATTKTLQEKVANSTSEREVSDIETWAAAEAKATRKPVPKANLDLAESMMRDWVLQHAGDEEDENADTSGAQWEKTKKRVGMAGDLDGRPDLFVHQSSYHLRQMGFSEGQIQSALQQMNAAVNAGKKPDPDAVRSKAESTPFTFTGPEFADALTGMLEKHSAFTVNDEGAQGVKDKNLVATMNLDLAVSDGTVYVDEWEYELAFKDGRYGFVFHHKKPPRKASVPLGVSPD
jgi:hypothetical protein